LGARGRYLVKGRCLCPFDADTERVVRLESADGLKQCPSGSFFVAFTGTTVGSLFAHFLKKVLLKIDEPISADFFPPFGRDNNFSLWRKSERFEA